MNTISQMCSWLEDQLAITKEKCNSKTYYTNGESSAYEMALFKLKAISVLNEDEVE